MARDIRDLEKQIDKAREELVAIFNGTGSGEIKAVSSIARWQSQIAIAVSEIAEISTRRLVKLTRWLVGLTVALFILTLVLAVFTIRLYQDAHANAHHSDFPYHAELQRP
jgi:hypothetical protein